MKNISLLIVLFLSFIFVSCSSSRFTNFVTVKNDKLMDGEKELRFVSFNIPNLHYIEDHFDFTSPNPWRLPNEYEIKDALLSIKKMGGKVTRIYTPSVRKKDESKYIIRHVEGPGKFNEEAFKAYDRVLKIANEVGIRIIIPLVDNWWWWGGPKEYADFRGKEKEEFWTDPQLISDFKKTVEFIINRKNTYTGIPFKEDKAVFGWETGNELECPFSWQAEISSYIKSLDSTHLVIEGTHAKFISEEALNYPDIDVLSTHSYSPADETVEKILKNREITKGIKPYFVGEFGSPEFSSVQQVIDTVVNNDVSGILLWSLRFHNRDGGFYYHTESFGLNPYRYPGFDSGQNVDEKQVLDFVREKGFKVNNEEIPEVKIPEPPELLPVSDVYSIFWKGSTGASSYNIYRKEENSDWIVIAENISDADIGYKPLFYDSSAVLEKKYFYRITAGNEAGISELSNEQGPVEVNYFKLVDEFNDSSNFLLKSGDVHFVDKDLYKAKEDKGRIEADSAAYIIYNTSDNIDSIRIEAYLTSSEINLKLFASPELGQIDSAKALPSKIETFPPYKNVYGFYTPIVFTCSELPYNSKYLKIDLKKGIQISRTEIIYGRIK